MKIKHYYSFDESESGNMYFKELNASNWDLLRTNEKAGPFSIEREINAYEQNCDSSQAFKDAARIICRLLKQYNIKNRLVSLGCGKGIVEWHIKRFMPELYIKCTDYTSEGLKLLEKVFISCNEFDVFDMMADKDYESLRQDDTVLMFRVSTEFSLNQWKEIFDKIYRGGVKYIVFVPADILTLPILINEKRAFFSNWLRHRKNTFSGWLYSRKEYTKIFMGTGKKPRYKIMHSEKLGHTEVMLLQRAE